MRIAVEAKEGQKRPSGRQTKNNRETEAASESEACRLAVDVSQVAKWVKLRLEAKPFSHAFN